MQAVGTVCPVMQSRDTMSRSGARHALRTVLDLAGNRDKAANV